MKRLVGVVAVIAVLAMRAVSPAAAACPNLDPCQGTCPVLIQFDANAFAHETNYSTATFLSTPGSQLNVVGLITQFGAGLAGLDANDPTKEYTFRLTGLTSQGTIVALNGPTTLYDANYDTLTAASFAIYEGTPRNSPATAADWAANPYGGALVPASHIDGTVILSGVICGFHTNIARTGTIVSGSFRASYHATGGTLFNLVGGTEGVLGGAWCANLTSCHPANYTAHPNGKFDASGVTAATTATWGKVKQIYR
jgi:hypothetical protein